MSRDAPLRDRAAIVGVGATPYWKRGRSAPRTLQELICAAIIAAAGDAGIAVPDIDGFAYFAADFDTGGLMETLGVRDVGFSSMLTGSGGGSAGAVGLAAAAIVAGLATTVVVVCGVQQGDLRYGAMPSTYAPTAESSFYQSAGLVGPGHMFALLARRHMHLYGTTREQLAEVAISTRANAVTHPDALMKMPLTLDDYFAAPMISDPHCLFDFCLESDGAVAVIVTSAERARDLRRAPVHVHASAQGGAGDWGRSIYWMNMPEETFATSGHAAIARRLFAAADVGPGGIDCAQIYDHFTSQVILQLEDYGFCARGEGGPFVASGAIRFDGGSLPVNTDGGQLSGGYIWGMSHVREAVEQLRGTAANQVADARFALVTGGPSDIPVSGLILRGGGVSRIAKRPPDRLATIVADRWTAPYWDAAAQGRLTCARCANCGRFRMPPTPFCPNCRHQDIEWPTLPGTGAIYSCTIVERAVLPGTEDSLPYVPAVVTLDGAAPARVITNIVDSPIDTIRIGARVRVVFDRLAGGAVVPRFVVEGAI